MVIIRRKEGLSFIEPYFPNVYHLVILLDVSPFGDTYMSVPGGVDTQVHLGENP